MTLTHRGTSAPPLLTDLVLLGLVAGGDEPVRVTVDATFAGRADEVAFRTVWQRLAEQAPALRLRLGGDRDDAPELEPGLACDAALGWLGAWSTSPADALWSAEAVAGTEQALTVRFSHHPALLDERSRLRLLEIWGEAYAAELAGREWSAAGLAGGDPESEAPAAGAQASDVELAEAFWRPRLSAAPVSRLWASGDGLSADRVAIRLRALDASMLRQLDQLAADLGTDPETIVEAALGLVLARATGSDEVRFVVRRATPSFAPRLLAAPGAHDLVRPSAYSVDAHASVREAVRLTAELHRAAEPHSWLPLSQLARWDAPRGSTRVADVLLMVDLEPALAAVRDALGGDLAVLREPTGFPLTITLRRSARPLLRAEFDAALVPEPTVDALLEALSTVLAQWCAAPDAPLGAIRLSPPEQPVSPAPFAPGSAEPAWQGGIASALSVHSLTAPQAPAVACGDESLTYDDLEARAALIGGHLRAAGVSRGDIVALHLERGPELAAAVLGILRVGAAWLPLDPAYPRGRTLDVLRRSGARCVLTQRALAGVLAEAGVPELLLEDAPSAEPVPPLEMSPDEPAYLIYTSGSTGTPKGVLVSHGNVVRYARALGEVVGLEPTDRWLHTASMAFSSSVRQLLVPLLNGATVVIARRAEVADPRELLRVARQARITIMDLVPSYWARVVEALEAEPALAVPSLRLALSASEPLPAAVLERWLRLAPEGQRFINMFGQTETTGIVAAGEVTLEDCRDGAILPLGRALPGNRLLVLDAAGQPLPAGLTGEIVVSGSNVGLGYLGDPELTAARFRPDPFHGNGARLYATGDRGYVRPDGRLAFVGRQDNQVKVRGHRVEVEEIEAVLTRHAAVTEAAVDVRVDAGGDVRLVAFVVPAVAGEAPAARELRDHLAATLPDYMMPAAFTPSVALPRTPNGKLDRAALRALAVDFAPIAPSYVAPRTPLESELSALWCEVLGVSRVGVSDHFFEIGGHSLMAIRVLARIRATHGVDLPVRVLFERPTVAALAEEISARLVSASAEVPLRPLADGAEAPLSFAEERLWVLHQMEPESAAYNLVAAFRIHGRLDRNALVAALSSIERRHQSLRTVFPSPDGMARAEVRPPRTFPLTVEHVASGESRDESLRARAAELAAVPFDLAEGPLFRGTLLEADTSDHLLVLVMHHVISDGWSRGVLYRELGEAYALFATGRPDDRPELAIQYRDYAAWQRARLTEGVIEAQSAYWSRQLAGPLPTLDLPTDRPRPPVQTYKGATHSFLIPPRLAERLRELGAAEDATSFMVLLAAFQALLGRYSGQDDVVVGSPTAGRTRVETEPLIGFFVNTLALRADLSGNPSFRSLLARVRRMALDAFEHQDLPFERLVESLKLPRDLSRSPLFQVLFILQNTPVHPLTLPGLTLQQVDVDAGAAKFDVTLALVNADGGYTGHLEYNTDLFDASTVERLAGHYVRLLEAAAEAPDRPIGRLALLTSPEREQLLHAWNATEVQLPTGDTIVSQFEAQVARTPEAPAATFELETLSYGELNARANRLAAHLRTLGVGPDTLVGIYMERSLEMLVGMLAAMKAGGAYLPLDPAYPDDRIAFMLEDSGAPVVLTQARLMSKLPAREGVQVVRVDADAAAFATRSSENPAPTAGPAHLAYQIYTSGSTGRPKGVMIEHRNVINFFVGMDERVGGDAPGTWLAVTSISFDISVLELLFTLTRGYHVIVQGDPERVRQQQAVKRSDRKLGFSIFYWGSDAHAATENRYRMLLDGAKFADANGFEAVWVPERHFHSFGGLYPSPAVASAAIAAATCRIKLRSGSVVLPLHSPVRVAEDWSVVDNLSNGRVGLGFASGWHDRDFVFAPDNYANRRQVLTDYIDIVRRLWRGETVTLPGGSGTPVQIATLPRPIQPELPVWVTAAGTPATYEMAGTTGANVLTHLLGQTPETLREKIAIYRAARKRAGHEGPGHVTLMLHTYVHEDMEHVKRTVWHPFREYLRTSVDLIKGLAEGRGQDMRSAEFTAEDMEALLDHAFHRYFDTSALLGTPETCSEMVERLKGMDVDEIACLIDFGIPDSETMGSLELLAELRRRSDESSATASADFDIKAQLERWNVTHFQCTPSMAAMLTQEPETRSALAGLQCLMVGGEAFPTALAGELQALVRGRVVNMYGPTETTIWSATHTLDGAAGAVPLGTPIANTVCHVVDRNLELVPVGVPGELLIGGEGVVRGYHARPELTAERFLDDPFLGRGRVYRTGDLVRWRADGRLEFLGRIDHQVKVRGHRIELGEIETALEAEASVREAVVMVRSFGADDNRLVAYVVPSRGTVDAGALRQALGARLPEYMVPQHVVSMERLPRTPNLKVDRKALPAPNEVAAAPAATFVQPGSELESQIAAIWRDVLQLPQVGVSDNFFDIGGHSLLTVKVHMRLRGAIDKPVSITDLFRFPTIRSLAEHLGGAAPAAPTGEKAQARADARREALQNRRARRGTS